MGEIKPMKAHINGITVEGTPQEIMEYERMMRRESEVKYHIGVKMPYEPRKVDRTEDISMMMMPINELQTMKL